GTVGYMAPEQIRGEAADVRSDLFAAGVILHQMLAGSPPFEAPSQHAIEERILHAAPHALPVGVPVELERIARRCLEKEPARRFQSASELHEQLSAFQSGLPGPASVLDDRLPARWGRHAARYAAIGLLAAASVSGGWYLLARGRRAPPVARPEPSIAVLPFADLSPHGDQAYFSDGVAAEIV